MSAYKGIPVSAAKRIAKEHDKDQVIVVAWDKAHGKTHVTTYGKTVEECAQAAEGGNFVKRALGWPEEACDAKPSRIKKLEANLTALLVWAREERERYRQNPDVAATYGEFVERLEGLKK